LLHFSFRCPDEGGVSELLPKLFKYFQYPNSSSAGANLGIKTPDALQIAAAQLAECSAFITNDRRLPHIDGLYIFQLSDYL
jgi:predicted nucleic acid-binding protein